MHIPPSHWRLRLPRSGRGLGLPMLLSCAAVTICGYSRCSSPRACWWRLSPIGPPLGPLESSIPSRFLVRCTAKFDDLPDITSQIFTAVPPSLLAAEKEEARAILSLFLVQQGMSHAVAARTIKRSDQFIDHLVSKLHSLHKSRYLAGRELSTLEIRDVLVPYLASLLEEHGNVLIDLVEKFPNPPDKKRAVAKTATPAVALVSDKEKAIARVTTVPGSEGILPPHISYLIEIGINPDQIKEMARRFPAIAYYSLERKIKPLVNFLLDVGVPLPEISTILYKRPQLCGMSIKENLIPTMTFLEGMGVDKKQWAKVIHRLPALITYSRQKLKASVDHLSELGLSEKKIGKILTRCPHIMSYSVDDKLRPTEDYFRSLGIDVATLMYRCPQAFGLSVDLRLKPTTEFFLEKYTIEEFQVMVLRCGTLYTYSLADNLKPKWDFFLTTHYPQSELIKFPQFFGYSLEERIKPRYECTMEKGVRLILNQMLSVSDVEFERILGKKMRMGGLLQP